MKFKVNDVIFDHMNVHTVTLAEILDLHEKSGIYKFKVLKSKNHNFFAVGQICEFSSSNLEGTYVVLKNYKKEVVKVLFG